MRCAFSAAPPSVYFASRKCPTGRASLMLAAHRRQGHRPTHFSGRSTARLWLGPRAGATRVDHARLKLWRVRWRSQLKTPKRGPAAVRRARARNSLGKVHGPRRLAAALLEHQFFIAKPRSLRVSILSTRQTSPPTGSSAMPLLAWAAVIGGPLADSGVVVRFPPSTGTQLPNRRSCPGHGTLQSPPDPAQGRRRRAGAS